MTSLKYQSEKISDQQISIDENDGRVFLPEKNDHRTKQI